MLRSPTGFVLLCAVYITALFIQGSVVTVASEDDVPEPLNCRKLMTSVGKQMFKMFGVCSKQLKTQYPTDKDFSDHIQCVVKCVLSTSKLIDEAGRMTNETLKGYLNKTLPVEFHEIGFILVEGCLEDFVHILNHDDEFCVSYGDFTKCLQDSVADYAEICYGNLKKKKEEINSKE